jgi:hypothetical protein
MGCVLFLLFFHSRLARRHLACGAALRPDPSGPPRAGMPTCSGANPGVIFDVTLPEAVNPMKWE